MKALPFSHSSTLTSSGKTVCHIFIYLIRCIHIYASSKLDGFKGDSGQLLKRALPSSLVLS